jgi:hypothetical protein
MKNFFRFFVIPFFLMTSSNAMQQPFLEFEAMKMQCTFHVMPEDSNKILADKLIRGASYCFENKWRIRMHPNISADLRARFSDIMYIIAQKLGRSILGFNPMMQRENPRPFRPIHHPIPPASQWTTAMPFKNLHPPQEERESLLITYNSPQDPGNPGETDLSGGNAAPNGFPDLFAYDENVPDEVPTIAPNANVTDVPDVPKEAPPKIRRTHPIQRVSPQQVPKEAVDLWPLKATPESRVKFLITKCLVKADVLTSLTAAILLMLMHLSQETLLPLAPAIPLRRRRLRTLHFA